MASTIDWFLWLRILNLFGTAYAQSRGEDTRALRYLNTATKIGSSVGATNEDLNRLHAKYELEVQKDLPTELAELDEIEARIIARSEAIQAAK